MTSQVKLGSSILASQFDIDITINDPCWDNYLQHYELESHAQHISALLIDYMQLQLNVPSIEYSIVLTNDQEIQKLNAAYRHKDKPTNVLSFGLYKNCLELAKAPWGLPLLLGDIVIAWETLTAEAIQYNKSFHHHFTHLLLHGFIHLLGYDHERSDEEKLFETVEIAVLKQLDITNPYEGIND